MYGMVLARHARFPHIKSTGTIGLGVYQAIQNPNIFVSPMEKFLYLVKIQFCANTLARKTRKFAFLKKLKISCSSHYCQQIFLKTFATFN
jgi:hypothetical protein